VLLQGRIQCRAAITGIQQTQNLDGFSLESLTQLHVILLVYFACPEIKRQILNGGVQGVFLPQ
jgi:hypothetical protein